MWNRATLHPKLRKSKCICPYRFNIHLHINLHINKKKNNRRTQGIMDTNSKKLLKLIPGLITLFGACATIGPRDATVREQVQMNQQKYMTGDKPENFERDVYTKPSQVIDPKPRIEITE